MKSPVVIFISLCGSEICLKTVTGNGGAAEGLSKCGRFIER
jgi:hypothetical protein